jgi:hypothetical protein
MGLRKEIAELAVHPHRNRLVGEENRHYREEGERKPTVPKRKPDDRMDQTFNHRDPLVEKAIGAPSRGFLARDASSRPRPVDRRTISTPAGPGQWPASAPDKYGVHFKVCSTLGRFGATPFFTVVTRLPDAWPGG